MDAKVRTKVKVRFADMDAMGHVNNAKFFTYFEQARVAYLRNIEGLDFTQMGKKPGESLILASIQCNFISPGFLDETLIVKIRVGKMGRSSFVFEYEINEETKGRQVATGESVQVYFDYPSQKSLPIPESLKAKFEEIEGRKLA